MAFDGEPKTETSGHGGKNDKEEVDWHMLDPKAIALPTGLQGVQSCADGKLIHGDMQEMLYNNRETHILMTDTLKIQQQHIVDIEQTEQIVVKQGREVMVGVYDKNEIQGDRTLWVHGKDDEHYLVHREINEPVERFEYKHICFEYGVAGTEAIGLKAETTGVAVALENVKVEASTCAFLNKAIEEKMSGIQSKLKVFETAVGLLLLAAQTKLNAAVNWAMSSPTS
jgi:hypothetical protein